MSEVGRERGKEGMRKCREGETRTDGEGVRARERERGRKARTGDIERMAKGGMMVGRVGEGGREVGLKEGREGRELGRVEESGRGWMNREGRFGVGKRWREK